MFALPQNIKRLWWAVLALPLLVLVISGQAPVRARQAVPCELEVIAHTGPYELTDALGPHISGNGRYIVFSSIVNYDSEETVLYDRQTGAIEFLSTHPGDPPEGNTIDYRGTPDISYDGSVVAFLTFKNLAGISNDGEPDIYVNDRRTGQLELISIGLNGQPPNDESWDPAISPDGRYVAFLSHATNLVEGDDNGLADIFLRDRQTGVTELVSVASDGSQGGEWREYGGASIDISPGGRYVVFDFKDLKGDDGVLHSGVFLRDRQAGRTYFLKEAEGPNMSWDGRYISMSGYFPEHIPDWGTLLLDLQTGTEEWVSFGPVADEGGAQAAALSTGARYMTFSDDTAFPPGEDTNDAVDVYYHDRRSGQTLRLSVNARGEEGDRSSYFPTISADGQVIAFWSMAQNLISDPPPGATSIYICDLSAFLPAVEFQYFLPWLGR